MNVKVFAMALLAATSFFGCALTTDYVQLQYNQQQGVVQIPSANNITVDVKLNDLRQDK